LGRRRPGSRRRAPTLNFARRPDVRRKLLRKFMKVTIKHRATGTVLASTDDPTKVESFEGNWYFDPSVVNHDALVVTDDTYTCSYKGTCNWINFSQGDATTKYVAWVYPKTLKGYEKIAGRYAFYSGNRPNTTEERE
jgi:uncharacterized protein (DUF427 family)